MLRQPQRIVAEQADGGVGEAGFVAGATKPVTPSVSRSGTAAIGCTTQGRPAACASATARQKLSPGSPR